MQLPPTILSIDKKNRKSMGKTPNNNAKSSTAKSEPAELVTDGKKLRQSAESLGDDSDSDDSLAGDEVLAKDESHSVPAVAKPAAAPKIKSSRTELRPPRTLETTLFDRLERMYGAGIKRMLKVQYRSVCRFCIYSGSNFLCVYKFRMHSQICEFPSKTLYSSKLTPHESVASHLLRDLPNVQTGSEEEKEVLGTPVVFFDTAGCEYFERSDGDNDEGSRRNENEATVVKNWIEKLVRSL